MKTIATKQTIRAALQAARPDLSAAGAALSKACWASELIWLKQMIEQNRTESRPAGN